MTFSLSREKCRRHVVLRHVDTGDRPEGISDADPATAAPRDLLLGR
jgi:hypothetical protein